MRWDGTPETKCPLKSHHLYIWDENGKISSPHIHYETDEEFSVALETLRLLHVSEHDLHGLCVLRDMVREQCQPSEGKGETGSIFVDPAAFQRRKANSNTYDYAHLLVSFTIYNNREESI